MTGEEIGHQIGTLIGIGILIGLGAVINAQPKDRTIKTFFEYFFAGSIGSFLLVVLWRGVSSFWH